MERAQKSISAVVISAVVLLELMLKTHERRGEGSKYGHQCLAGPLLRGHCQRHIVPLGDLPHLSIHEVLKEPQEVYYLFMVFALFPLCLNKV